MVVPGASTWPTRETLRALWRTSEKTVDRNLPATANATRSSRKNDFAGPACGPALRMNQTNPLDRDPWILRFASGGTIKGHP